MNLWLIFSKYISVLQMCASQFVCVVILRVIQDEEIF